jgi:hypothetical protein
MIEEIKRMRGSYSQKNTGTPRSVPYAAVEKLFDFVEEWARHERVETAAKRIEEAAEKMEKQEGGNQGKRNIRAGGQQGSRRDAPRKEWSPRTDPGDQPKRGKTDHHTNPRRYADEGHR